MKQSVFFLLLSAALLSCQAGVQASLQPTYSWDEPSLIGSAGSMPLGGGDIGMNVWVEPDNHDVYFYLSQSGCFDENNTLLKLGRFHVGWRYRETGDCLPLGAVRQSLWADQGYMTIQSGSQTITLWADTEHPVVHIELSSAGKQKGEVKQADGSTEQMEIHPELFVEYESWREQDRPITKAECQQSSWKWILPEGTVTYADHLSSNRQALPDQPVWFYHQNRDTTVFDYCVTQQLLDQYKDSLYNPLSQRIFGGRVTMDPDRQHAQIVLCNQQSSLDDWWQQIAQTESQIDLARDRQSSRAWWSQYMQRSFIQLPQGSADPELQPALRNYRLFRYMLGCNAKGQWPTKFNGGLFTFVADSTDASPFRGNEGVFTPDFRKWGGGTHTAQNQRLVYWGMLKSGDTDLMRAQLDYYLRLLQTAELRSRVYWGHQGACYTEQMENFGLPNPAEYGKHPDKKGNGQDPGVENNRWLEYEWDTALEFCQMALEAHRYAGMDITTYEPMILSCLRFFDQHYTQCDSLGRKVIFPGSGCETYKIARNSASTVAALIGVCTSYLAYQHNDEVAQMLAHLPLLPTYEQQGKPCLAPAESWERINNVETPQLYPVWPWRLTGVWDDSQLNNYSKLSTLNSPLYKLALNTYQCDSIALKNRTYIGWKQDNIWAACLGLTDDAYSLTMQKLADGPFRFPAFWGPGYDWMPDHNWGGSAVIGLEEMLLQENPVTGELLILPAWPKDKDIHFKLHATGGRIVEVTQKDGKITQKVTQKFGDKK